MPSYDVSMGRQAEFADFVRAQRSELAGFCFALVGDAELAGEYAQEALVRTWLHWPRVREPRAYAFLVVTNLVRDAWRRQQRERAAIERIGSAQPAAYEMPDAWLRDLVERLPERLRAPVLLHYYADLPVAEVARLLRRPEGSVKQRLHEARTRLARSMEDR